jgi:catechol 2,3-dioxygenase-like lactoylglutathione lyase family enzyme
MGCEIAGLGVHIKVADIEKSRKFYESLGFKPIFAYGDEKWRGTFSKSVGTAPEKYRGVTFQISENAQLEVAEGHIAIKDNGIFQEIIKSPKISAMIRVKSIAPLFKNPNINIKFPIRHYYWGTIEAAFRDPDGFVLVFIAPYSKEEFDAVKKYSPIEEINAK